MILNSISIVALRLNVTSAACFYVMKPIQSGAVTSWGSYSLSAASRHLCPTFLDRGRVDGYPGPSAATGIVFSRLSHSEAASINVSNVLVSEH